jgi:hypothetical protein
MERSRKQWADQFKDGKSHMAHTVIIGADEAVSK